MDIPRISAACQTIIADLRKSMEYFRKSATADDRVYSLAFVSREGLDYTMLYIAHEKRLTIQNSKAKKKSDQMRNKWDYSCWDGPGDEVDTSELLVAMPWEPDMESSHYAALRGAIYLSALTNCLKVLVKDGTMNHKKKPIVAFCSMIDSADAPWVERETARIINTPKVYQEYLPEQKIASKACYRNLKPDTSLLEQYFKRLQAT